MRGRLRAPLGVQPFHAHKVPLFEVVTQVFKFLNRAAREEEPYRDRYGDASPRENGGRSDEDDEELDNEGKTLLYFHLLEFEQTQLRKVYVTRMQQSHPDWATRVEIYSLKAYFLEAVRRCRGGFHLKRISQWVDAVMQGNFPRLAEALQERWW
ncbi:hypothetical protein CGRA01v4_00464 [Colletotrichum graminicola]|nr:hypothetical protein CGRA01v4_00464 [Colletotrichum graminicola]